MSSQRRGWFARMLIAGLACVALLLWLALARRGVGASYYFPAWSNPEALRSESYEEQVSTRLAALDAAPDRVDILFEVSLREPPRLAAAADTLREKLPAGLGRLVPEYADYRYIALRKIAENAQRNEFVAATLRFWPRWNPETRQMWLSAVDQSVGSRPEYRGLLVATVAEVDPLFASLAVRRLGDYQPFPREAVGQLAPLLSRIASMTNTVWHRAAANHVMSGVREHPELPDDVVEAVGKLRDSSQPTVGLIAELCVAGLRPQRGIDTERWKAKVMALSSSEAVSFMQALARPEFRETVLRGVVQDWLQQVAFEQTVIRRDPKRPESVLPAHRAGRLLEHSWAGRSAPALVAPLLARMGSTNESVQLRAARLFAVTAPRDPDLLAKTLPVLTNSAVAATPLLLWIASLGTNAAPAVPEVLRIATSRVRYWRPRHPTEVDPQFLDPWTTKAPAPVERVLRYPASIRVDPPEVCPDALRTYWPGAKFRSDRTGSQGTTWGDWSGFESKRLDELALMTLTRILPPEELAELRAGGVVQGP